LPRDTRPSRSSIPALDGALVDFEGKRFVNMFVDNLAVLASRWHGWVVVSPESCLLATLEQDKTVRLRDVAKGTPRASSKRQNCHILPVAFTPDRDTLATSDPTGLVRHWEVTGTK
jgi:hypothetical protein